MHRNMLKQFKNYALAQWSVPVMLLALLSGCVTVAPVKSIPMAATPADPQAAVVAPLEDGRDGFVITEVSDMDEASLLAFENAVVLFNEENYAGAIELLEQVIEQAPGITAPHIDLAMAYRRMDQQEKAETHFKTALQLIPGHPVASNEYGLLCRKAGRFDEARTIYEQALERFPHYYPVHRNLGILCDIYLNDLAGALAHYQRYSQAMPEDAQVKLWIADLNARLGVNNK